MYKRQINGRGTSSTLQHYSLKDNAPFNGMNYYRMIQVDLDGTKHIQDKVVSVEFHKNGKVIITPNPVKENKLSFNFNTLSQRDILIDILDLRGEVLRSQALRAEKGKNYFDVDLPGMVEGIYLLRVVQQGEVQTMKFVKE